MTDTLAVSKRTQKEHSKVVPWPGGEREKSVKSVEKNLSHYPQLHFKMCSCRAGESRNAEMLD